MHRSRDSRTGPVDKNRLLLHGKRFFEKKRGKTHLYLEKKRIFFDMKRLFREKKLVFLQKKVIFLAKVPRGFDGTSGLAPS